ncbi:hypothetical protein E8E12_008155 [Didymella heteroderae]|uniref:Telomeric single stranded DNA binding POT1/Cdc13 domain-containing protein n=1 Tax=Didymella heteroderae TaxID=1769908 RepID=A0A9P4WQY3_9PLEO|nr:hypothetical protein E8E12_008155 [Didymella heteroderae]
MEHVHIAALQPNLDALDSKQIKAVVTLIWPYSSSQRQFALLLAEPDFRLRRKKGGQVRARFSSTSARALAATGVGIGDEVVLSLHGAQFVQDGVVSTPGKSIDWELAYTQTVAISVRRGGTEIANLELIDAAPTPAPRSPVKRAAAAPSPIPQWSSPAFLKRARLSDGPFFEQPAFDPLADAYNEGHDRKRRRKSYRDWTAWTYTTRTPSPEKEDVGMDDDLEEAMSSPSRRPQLPKTPISPLRTEATSVAAEAHEDLEYVEETTIADSADGDTTVDDGELQKVYAPLSTRPERSHRDAIPQIEYGEPPLESAYDFGGDTELNTEDEDEGADATVPEVEAVDVSATEVATELEDEPAEVEEKPAGGGPEVEARDVEASAPEEGSEAESELRRPEDVSEEAEDTTLDETVPEVVEPAILVEDALAVTMPPPTLPALHTDFAAPTSTELLTPIGRAPSSPNLQAVDSATLPLPSPFPGEQATSYFDQASEGQQQAPLDGYAVHDGPAADYDADYIMENSFFSSISSSRAGGAHQDHETAFTPVRFTFGMDGAGWSRPLELSSPPPDDAPSSPSKESAPTVAQDRDNIEQEAQTQTGLTEQSELVEDVSYSSLAGTFDGDVTSALRARNEAPEVVAEPVSTPAEPISKPVKSVPQPSNMVVLSSDVESEDGEDQVEDDDESMADPDEEQSTEPETASESEHEAESESDAEIESELDEIDASQALPATEDQAHAEPENITPSTDSGIIYKAPQSPEDDEPPATRTSAAVSEVMDLGSLSGDEVSETDQGHEQIVDPGQSGEVSGDLQSIDRTEMAEDIRQSNSDLRVGLTGEATDSTIPESTKFDDFIGANMTQKSAIVLSSSPDRPIHEPASINISDTHEDSSSLALDVREPQLGIGPPLPFIDDRDLPGDAHIIADAEVESADTDLEAPVSQDDAAHSDIKMESVEDGSLYLISQSQDVPQESATDSATEPMTATPEKGYKLGEPQLKSVPATAPARNTRSKAKSAASPVEEDGYVSRLSTSMRRTRSKASFDSTDRDSTSPTQARGPQSSTVTPTRTSDAMQTSPYSLRSQSKQLSPEQSTTASRTPIRKSSRKLVRGDTDFDLVPSQSENPDLSGSISGPSQELGPAYTQLSQDRYLDLGFAKGSEQDTSHSEGVVSTVHHPDDDRVRGSLVDPVEVAEDVQPATPRVKPPPSFLHSSRQTRSRSRSMGQQSAVSPVQPPRSPRRSPRLTRSTFSPTPSPRLVRTTSAAVQVSSPVPEVAEEEQSEDETPKAKEKSIVYPELPAEGVGDLRGSPPAPHSAQQSNLQESNLLTPDDTQGTTMDPPLSFQARQPEQSLLITPDLTQQASATTVLRSFDIPLPGIETQPAPHSPILRTSPRHKPGAAEPKPSPPAQRSSPTQQQSSEVTSAQDEDATLVTKPDPPSIGLSTPLAYYTPLRDLIYFLNRSSQFHSSTYPDILALCTSASNPPEKAKKGPRHWTTTLHITDLSIWPEVRTVQCFRAYQSALPQMETGDVVLLRAFKVESHKREPVLRSVDESSWCVWRFGKPVWGKKGGKWGELRAREEVKGPVVERGQGEWTEVEKLRAWYAETVKGKLERQAAERGSSRRELRSSGKAVEVEVHHVEGDE